MRKTTDWRAVCGRTACTVRRAGRTSVLPDPYQIPGVVQSPAAMSDMPGYPNFVAAFQHNVPRFEIPPEKVVTHQMKSEQIPLGQASSFLGGSVRLISLDGDHRRASIGHDLRLSKEVLSDFGVVIVDDILSAWAPSVTEGIIDFLRPGRG